MKVIGNLQVLGKKSIIQFNPELTGQYEYSGWITTEYVEVAVTPGQVLFFNSSTLAWKLAQANNISTIPGRGLALETKGIGEKCKILRMGTFRHNSWNLTGTNIYVSPTVAGGLQSTIPSASAQLVQTIGYPIAPNIGYFDFCPIAIEIA